ncbi:hypothetical protein ACFU44_00590 [Nocardia rhizosphaerihabitans]|uniref:hypothetical protein n=1 Tax=Nocardia rhizosphaerihabitans TaxID=1691570 RepID=UPI00366FF2AC
MTYTARQLESEIDELYDGPEVKYTYLQWRTKEPVTAFGIIEGWSWIADEMGVGSWFVLGDFGRVSVIEAETGGEGHGEHCELVLRVESPDGVVRYFQKNGYYASFYGTDWDGAFFEVTPEQQTVTVYTKLPKGD